MKALISQKALFLVLAVTLFGGSGWFIYTKWSGSEVEILTQANEEGTDATTSSADPNPGGTQSTQHDADLTIAAPDAALFNRLAGDETSAEFRATEFDVSGNGSDFQPDRSATFSIGDTGDGDSFVIRNPATVTVGDGTEFNVGDGDFTPAELPEDFQLPATNPPVATVDSVNSSEFQINGGIASNGLVLPENRPVPTGIDSPSGLDNDFSLAPGIAGVSPGTTGSGNTSPANPLQLLDILPSLDPTGVVGSSGNSFAVPVQNMPGNQKMEGIQVPSLSIEKSAPPEVQVNRPALFTTHIKNTGKITAHGLRVTDFIPRGARLESAHPEFIRATDGSIQWNLDTLEPGEEVTVSMKVIPLAEGEIGSVATVSFAARASVRTVSTRPQLTISQSFNETVLIGEIVLVNVVVSNPGSGDATGVVIEADIPEELSHAAGNELEYKVGTLRPGQSKQLSLRLHAKRAGIVQNIMVVRGQGRIANRSIQPLRIIAPALQVALRGPSIRYLDRQTIFAVDVANPGSASARNVELVAYLPKGLKFISTDHHGEYAAAEHAVFWKLEELPPTGQDSVKLTAVAVEPGEQKIRLEGTANLGLQAEFEHIVKVESVPELEFSVKDIADPIEIGSDTTYEIKVVNRGTRTATGVQVHTAFPSALRPIQGGGPSDVRIEGQFALFAPLDRLAPGDEAVFRVKAKALAQGDVVIRVQMTSDDVNTPVTKEESTRIYTDN